MLLYPAGLDFIRALFASFAAHLIAAPLPLPRRGHRSDRLLHVIEDACPAAILTNSESQAGIERALGATLAIPIVATDVFDIGSQAERHRPERATRREDLAVLQYTSGSTGAPKGVQITHGNMAANLRQIQLAFGHGPDSRAVIWLPHYHDMGLVGGVLQPFFSGFEVTLTSPLTFIRRPLRWLSAINRYRATTSGGPNFA